MKTKPTSNAVQLMRTLRDRMSEEMKGMTPRQQIEYMEKRSGLKRKPRDQVSTDAGTGS